MTIVDTPHLYSIPREAFLHYPSLRKPLSGQKALFDKFTFLELSAPHKFDHMEANILDTSIGLQRYRNNMLFFVK